MTESGAPFRRVLVANRGEIACRVLRGVREVGAAGVAVYSDADQGARHVQIAEAAVALGAPEPAASYLDIDKLIAAARDTGCDAIHPGYGFLAENADFVRATEKAGLVFIGPTVEAMEALGDKRAAKSVAKAAGVPCVPCFDGVDASDDDMREAARRLGFPVLIKASAGGGGRGMRVVTAEADFFAALTAARREAKQAFCDDAVLVERFVQPARHIEVQVIGDGDGGVIALGERECSIQRRHQKLLEESPSPFVSDDLRQRLESAAVSLAREVRYRNAGTVEFLVDEAGDFRFLEVNTRLQVEHPVTELVTGVDLVHLQLWLAAGRSLANLLPEGRPALRGHALEARICAEDPQHNFLPAAGRLAVCVEPEGPGVRVDSGFGQGDEIPAHYDSLLAKVIVHASDRAAAVQRMQLALKDAAWLGLPTNTDLIARVVEHTAFKSGDLRTDFLAVHPELLAGNGDPPDTVLQAAALAGAFHSTSSANSSPTASTASPWDLHDDFRLSGAGS